MIFAFFLISCEKEFLVPKKELPDWLVEAIKADEKEIDKNEKSPVAAGSWTRTEWNGAYYYEYFNGLSSSTSMVKSQNGADLDVYVAENDSITPYHLEKCCFTCIWKGPYGICFYQH